MIAAVFLDRDNTLIHNDGDLGDPDAVKLVKGAASAIASLRGLSYKIVVVTNQGGVARGKFNEADVEAVHERIAELVKATSGSPIDRFYYCPFHPEAKSKKYRRDHPWRKPQPGMLLQAQQDFGLDLSRSWLIGDQMRDVQAAAAAGVRAILLDSQKPGISPTPSKFEKAANGKDHPDAPPSYWVASSIIEAVKVIAQQGRIELTSAESSANPPARRRPRTPDTANAQASQKHAAIRSNAFSEPSVGSSPHAQPQQSARPFRPWMIQPADDEILTASLPTDLPEVEPSQPSSDQLQPQPLRLPSKPAENPPSDANKEPSAQPTQNAASATPQLEPTEHILRQILQELRSQRGMESEFSYHHMIAIVLQMVAAVCLLGGLWMGSTSLDQYVRWLGVAIGFQLAALTMLMFRR